MTHPPASDPATTAPPTPSGGDPAAQQLAQRLPHGPTLSLLQADDPTARRLGTQIAAHLRTRLVIETPWNLESSGDPAETLRSALRDALLFQRRRIERVLAGRIVDIQTPGKPDETKSPGDTPGSWPPSRLQVELETHEDHRSVQLEGAWAWNLHASGAQVGDLVQIDRQHPLVTLTTDPSLLDGRVLDDRDHRIQIPLGALDRVHAQGPLSNDAEEASDTDDPLIHEASRSDPLILGTGEHPPTGPAARAKTDAWVRMRLGERHTRILPAVLFILHASRLPDRCVAALQAALSTPGTPRIVLVEETAQGFNRLQETWPQAKRLEPHD